MLSRGRHPTAPTHSPSRARVIATCSSRRRSSQRSRSLGSCGGVAGPISSARTSGSSTCLDYRPLARSMVSTLIASTGRILTTPLCRHPFAGATGEFSQRRQTPPICSGEAQQNFRGLEPHTSERIAWRAEAHVASHHRGTGPATGIIVNGGYVNDTTMMMTGLEDGVSVHAADAGANSVLAECWIFDTDAQHVVLVEHRWRGWVPPGGAVEPGEDPRAAARRELLEEAGIWVVLSQQPVLASLRSYRSDWQPSLSLTFAAVVDRCELRGESGQPCAWMPLALPWTSVFPEDRARMRTFLASGK